MLFCCPRSQLLQCSFHGCERQLSQSKLNLWGALANSPTPSFSPTSSSYRHPVFFYPGWQKQVIAGATDPPFLTNTRTCSLRTIVTPIKLNFRCIGTTLQFRFQIFRGAKTIFFIRKEQRRDGWCKVVLVYISVILFDLMRLRKTFASSTGHTQPHLFTVSCDWFWTVMWLGKKAHLGVIFPFLNRWGGGASKMLGKVLEYFFKLPCVQYYIYITCPVFAVLRKESARCL